MKKILNFVTWSLIFVFLYLGIQIFESKRKQQGEFFFSTMNGYTQNRFEDLQLRQAEIIFWEKDRVIWQKKMISDHDLRQELFWGGSLNQMFSEEAFTEILADARGNLILTEKPQEVYPLYSSDGVLEIEFYQGWGKHLYLNTQAIKSLSNIFLAKDILPEYFKKSDYKVVSLEQETSLWFYSGQQDEQPFFWAVLPEKEMGIAVLTNQWQGGTFARDIGIKTLRTYFNEKEQEKILYQKQKDDL